MSDTDRELRLNRVFVRLADTLVDDYDTVELLHELVEACTDLLGAEAGGLLLADAEGTLQVVASTSEAAQLVEIMQANANSGPCVDCFVSGVAVSIPDVAATRERWPEFADAAAQGGFRSVFATPLRLRGRTLGAMNLFGVKPGVLSDRDIATAQALADVATIGILQERMIRESVVVTEQLQHALDSRVLIEQAKGVLSEARSISMDDAFALLRRFARREGMTLRRVAESVATRSIDLARITAQ